MNSEPLVIEDYRAAKKERAAGKENIFLEMHALGIDPQPFLEIAAHDLINQYGKNALNLSQKIEKDFMNEDDPQSAEIWSKISAYLESLNASGALVAH